MPFEPPCRRLTVKASVRAGAVEALHAFATTYAHEYAGAADACARRDEHVAYRRTPCAGAVRQGPGRRAAADRRRRGGAVRVPAGSALVSARRAGAATALPRRALRRDPRTLRAD